MRHRRAKQNSEYLSLFLDDELSVLIQKVTKYWEEKFSDYESKRFSKQQREFFDFLKNLTKYNQFEKREGGIVNSLLIQNEVTHEPKVIDKSLAEYLQKIHTPPTEQMLEEKLQFPTLQKLDKMETELIC